MEESQLGLVGANWLIHGLGGCADALAKAAESQMVLSEWQLQLLAQYIDSLGVSLGEFAKRTPNG